MKVCRDCKGTNIKSRINYSHGKKSKSITSYTCNNCGSSSIEVKSDNKRFGQRRR